MEQNTNQTNESSNNGWQNIGIMCQYAKEKNMSPSQKVVFTEIVMLSFGYGRVSTNSITIAEMAKSLGYSSPTLIKIIDELVEAGHVTKRKKNSFGSTPYMYSPKFPSFANIHIADRKNKKDNSNDTENKEVIQEENEYAGMPW